MIDRTYQNRKEIQISTGENNDTLIRFDDVAASWNPLGSSTDGRAEKGSDPCVLRNVSFTLSRGEKVAVIGAVGSGKTSLLLSILGEVPIQDGTVYTKASEDIVFVE